MVQCPACGRKQRPGTLFCPQCGVYLPTGGPLDTRPLPDGEHWSSYRETWTKDVFQTETRPSALWLRLLSTGRQVQLPMTAEVLIGRLDADSEIFPDLDLTSDGGLEGGVSRRHCKIHRRGSTCFIEDVGSTNGTFVDGRRLPAYLPQAIRNGDQIQLGELKMEVIIAEDHP